MIPKAAGKPANAQQMFQAARVFEEASELIHEAMSKGKMRLAVTWGVNAAFALELYLKCLLVLEGGTAPAAHNLKELFRNLPRQTKDDLKKEHDALAARDETFVNVKKHFPDEKFDLESLLEQGKDAFTLFRYAYEGLPEGVGFSLNVFSWCIRNRVLRLHPEWDT